jgi:hypothetical protein
VGGLLLFLRSAARGHPTRCRDQVRREGQREEGRAGVSRLRILEVVLRETRAKFTGADRLGLATILSFELSDGRSAAAPAESTAASARSCGLRRASGSLGIAADERLEVR